MKKLFPAALLSVGILAATVTQAQKASTAYQTQGQTVRIKTKTADLQIQVFSPNTVRVLRFPVGSKATKTSLSVNKAPDKTPFETAEAGGVITVKTALLTVSLNRQTGLVSFATRGGKSLLQEGAQDSLFVPTTDNGQPAYRVQQRFKLSAPEGIYGLGQFQDGIMNWRNHAVKLRQLNQYVANPFLVSTAGYGILWDNYSTTVFRDNAAGASFSAALGDCSDYYFVYGQTMDGTVAGYRTLTGAAPCSANGCLASGRAGSATRARTSCWTW